MYIMYARAVAELKKNRYELLNLMNIPILLSMLTPLYLKLYVYYEVYILHLYDGSYENCMTCTSYFIPLDARGFTQ